MITKEVLSEDDQAELPCIAIPDAIAITQMLANAKLLERLESLGLSGVNELSAEMQLALFIAAERSLGVASLSGCGVLAVIMSEIVLVCLPPRTVAMVQTLDSGHGSNAPLFIVPSPSPQALWSTNALNT